MKNHAARVGILLTNLGTPDAPTAPAVRRYLREFLWDPRVVDLPRPLWWFILHAFVLTFRPKRSAAAYAKIWTEEGSPLLVIGRRQAAALESSLDRALPYEVPVELGMRYGAPSILEALHTLQRRDCEHVVVLPLYPQYSSSTTASATDGVQQALDQLTRKPTVDVIEHYFDHPAYVSALAQSVRDFWEREGEAERLLISFHGTPQRYHANGDPYRSQCEATAARLAAALELPADRWQLTFQSRFGPEAWLQPYTDKTLVDWGQRGVASVDVLCPGFAADCLETLEEIDMQNRKLFVNAGGGRFRYIPALNDRDDHIAALSDLVLRRIAPGAVAAP